MHDYQRPWSLRTPAGWILAKLHSDLDLRPLSLTRTLPERVVAPAAGLAERLGYSTRWAHLGAGVDIVTFERPPAMAACFTVPDGDCSYDSVDSLLEAHPDATLVERWTVVPTSEHLPAVDTVYDWIAEWMGDFAEITEHVELEFTDQLRDAIGRMLAAAELATSGWMAGEKVCDFDVWSREGARY